MSNKTTINKPSYYAILTADVRYNSKLTAQQKLLFAELTALTGINGYAWPSNKWLSELYGVSERTISRDINALKDAGFIDILIDKNTKGSVRKIFVKTSKKSYEITDSALDKNVYTPLDKNVYTPLDKNGECYLISNTRELVIQDINKSYVIDEPKVYKSKPILTEIPTLSFVEKIAIKNKIKKSVYEKFFYYYQVRNFETNDRLITTDNVESFLLLWDARENDFKNITNTEDMKKDNPEWLNEYMEELKSLELN